MKLDEEAEQAISWLYVGTVLAVLSLAALGALVQITLQA